MLCVCVDDVRNIVCVWDNDDEDDDDDEPSSSVPSDDVVVVGRQSTASLSPTRQVFDCSRLGTSRLRCSSVAGTPCFSAEIW